MTIHLKDEVKHSLESFSEITHRSRSYLTAPAIADYVELNQWQIAEIQQGIIEADAGDFADDSEVQAFFARHK